MAAANSLQSAPLVTHPVASCRDHHTGVFSQNSSSGSREVVKCRALPATAGTERPDEQVELIRSGKSSGDADPQRARQEVLWRLFFLDASLWRDERPHKRKPQYPDFRHKESKVVLRLDSVWKPAWVDDQLAALDAQLGPPPLLNSTLSKDHSLVRIAGSECQATPSALIKLCEKQQLDEAVDALSCLVQCESRVSASLFYSVLKGCVAQKNLELGRRVHQLAVKAGSETNTFLANHFLRMYAFHGRLQEVMEVFNGVSKPDAFSWSAVIAAHAKHGEAKEAVRLYQKMRVSSVKPDDHVFLASLQACANAADVESGMQVHADMLESAVQPKLFVWNCLVDMYAKCGRLDEARAIFDNLDVKDVVTWNAMIAGYAEHERSEQALSLYEEMERDGLVLADSVTFACLLKVCARIGALHKGKQLHAQVAERGIESDVVVGTCLLDMYAKCGQLEDARSVFDSLPSKNGMTWNAMIAGYAEHNLGEEALYLYNKMEMEGVVEADQVTFACLLKACASVGDLKQGKRLHSKILLSGLESDVVVGTALVDMYGKCGRVEDARSVFDSLPSKNVVTWNAMLTGYAEHSLGQEALSMYEKMEQEGKVTSNRVTLACLLKSCARVGALQQGKLLHSQIVSRGLESDILLGNCLVDMYAKFGMLEDACRVFDSLSAKDVVTWTIMINGLGQSNEGRKAIKCYEDMVRDGVQGNEATYTCLLVACSHEGLVEEGRHFFKIMVEEYGIKPTIEHKTCMVDLLGRGGHLEEAEEMLLTYEGNDVGFMSLLYACKTHGDLERGLRCFDRLIRSDPGNAGAYVLMANLYADAGRWSDVERIERLRKSSGVCKKPAVAGIEVDRHVHTFVVGEGRGDISSKAGSINARLKELGGHVPRTVLVLKNLPEQEKENELCGHAEKLALAYGLMNTPAGTPLLVTKNLRMCADCHDSTEIMSLIEKRPITVRDAHRVHRFENGVCQCGGRP